VADEVRGTGVTREEQGGQVVRVPLEQARVEHRVARRRAEAAPVVREHAPAAGEPRQERVPGPQRARAVVEQDDRRRAAGRLFDVERIRGQGW
jgi:hypothetical protein